MKESVFFLGREKGFIHCYMYKAISQVLANIDVIDNVASIQRVLLLTLTVP